MKNENPSLSRIGFLLGISAILIWSFSAAFVYLGAKSLGTWPFVAVAGLIGGTSQLIFRKIYFGDIRRAVFLPGRLWLAVVVGFILYGMCYPWALVSSRTQGQACAVNLLNYLWPTFTVLFAVFWVPNTKFSLRLLGALCLALIGMGVANYKQIYLVLHPDPAAVAGSQHYLPYLLGFLAAILWAMYSSLLARWKAWSGQYTTCSIGFILLGLTAAGVGLATGTFSFHIGGTALLMLLLYSFGPAGAGYLLWELSLSRGNIKTLGLLGALLPILSTLWLCVFLGEMPGVEIFLAAGLVSGGVLLSVKS